MERLYGQSRVHPEDQYEMTYGISADPLTHFSMVLASLVHDVGHPGVPNGILVKEESRIALLYDGQVRGHTCLNQVSSTGTNPHDFPCDTIRAVGCRAAFLDYCVEKSLEATLQISS